MRCVIAKRAIYSILASENVFDHGNAHERLTGKKFAQEEKRLRGISIFNEEILCTILRQDQFNCPNVFIRKSLQRFRILFKKTTL